MCLFIIPSEVVFSASGRCGKSSDCLGHPKNPYLNKATKKILAKFSYPLKNRNRKFQTQKHPLIIPVTRNLEYPSWWVFQMNAFFFSHQQEPANNNYKFLRITPKLSKHLQFMACAWNSRRLSIIAWPHILWRVYNEPIQRPAPSSLVVSIDRALHRYRRGQGFESCAWIFFRHLFATAKVASITVMIFFHIKSQLVTLHSTIP